MSHTPVKIDSSTGAAISISYPHHEIHDGCAFTASELFGPLNAGVGKVYRIVTPNTTKWVHMVIEVSAIAQADYILSEGDTFTANGTAMGMFNNDRNSSATATLVISQGATIDVASTTIESVLVPSGKKAGGESATRLEWILKQNTAYAFTVTSRAASNDLSIGFHWYEHTDIA